MNDIKTIYDTITGREIPMDWPKKLENNESLYDQYLHYPYISASAKKNKESKALKKKNFIYIDQNEMNPALRITGDVQGDVIKAIHANSHVYLGVYSSGKLEITQMSDSNKRQMKDGTILTSAEGNMFMKLPEFWWNCEETEDDVWKCGFSRKAVDGWNHWDGKYFIGVHEAKASQQNNTNNASTSNNALNDYSATLSDQLGYSGYSSGSIPQDVFRQMARNLGEGFTITTWNVHCLMALLFFAWYGNTNSQSICGTGDNNYNRTIGLNDSLGMTDTTSSNSSISTNFWGLENWWGGKFEWIDNLYCYHDDKNVNHIFLYNEDDTTYREVVLGQWTAEQIEAYGDCEDSLESYHNAVLGENFDLLPTPKGAYIEDGTLITGNDSHGYCDYMYIGCITLEEDADGYSLTDKNGTSHQCAHPGCVGRRSCNGADTHGGVVYSCLDSYPDETDGNGGARLQYHGDYIELSNAEYSEKYL